MTPGAKNCSCPDLVRLSLPVCVTQGRSEMTSDINLTTRPCRAVASDSAQAWFFSNEPVSSQCGYANIKHCKE